MIERDILQHEATQHHGEHHGTPIPDAHSGGIAPPEPASPHGIDAHSHSHHETEIDGKEGSEQ
jgi:hypothetical protein